MKLIVEQLCIAAEMKGSKKERIVHNMNFVIEGGKKLAIVGRSGCGKTMTAMAILGLLPENCTASGSILLDNIELLTMSKKERRSLCGTSQVLIPQSGSDFLNPSLTIKRQMTESLKRAGIPRKQHANILESLLLQVGFDDPQRVLSSYPFQLSGCMAQRIVMAIAMSGTPQLVIADEPTRGIDQENTAKFMLQINELFSNTAFLLITHDISVAAQCDHILVIDGGKSVEYGTSFQVIHQPKEDYTKKLICDLLDAMSHPKRRIG